MTTQEAIEFEPVQFDVDGFRLFDSRIFELVNVSMILLNADLADKLTVTVNCSVFGVVVQRTPLMVKVKTPRMEIVLMEKSILSVFAVPQMI